MNATSSSRPKLFSTLGQICKLIPAHLVARLARETGAAQKARTFTPWSHGCECNLGTHLSAKLHFLPG
jgi:hypothetical protein